MDSVTFTVKSNRSYIKIEQQNILSPSVEKRFKILSRFNVASCFILTCCERDRYFASGLAFPISRDDMIVVWSKNACAILCSGDYFSDGLYFTYFEEYGIIFNGDILLVIIANPQAFSPGENWFMRITRGLPTMTFGKTLLVWNKRNICSKNVIQKIHSVKFQ